MAIKQQLYGIVYLSDGADLYVHNIFYNTLEEAEEALGEELIRDNKAIIIGGQNLETWDRT